MDIKFGGEFCLVLAAGTEFLGQRDGALELAHSCHDSSATPNFVLRSDSWLSSQDYLWCWGESKVDHIQSNSLTFFFTIFWP